jgi:hypothetical protein
MNNKVRIILALLKIGTLFIIIWKCLDLIKCFGLKNHGVTGHITHDSDSLHGINSWFKKMVIELIAIGL